MDAINLLRAMGLPSGFEWIIIAIVIGGLVFGAKKIPELARSIGRAQGEYQKARIEGEREIQQIKSSSEDNKNNTKETERQKLEQIAHTLGISYSNKSDDELRFAIKNQIQQD
jgi:sec-independent protein translocase protein TatA